MNILAFDTCLDKMYVALLKGDVLSSKIIETTEQNYHSAFLISTIREILIENNLTPDKIDFIATNIGPGSFTGIRACTTVARVFAQSFDIKAVGVSSLEILSRINDSDKASLVALDARKDMAFVAIFKGGEEILKPQSMLLDDVKKLVESNQIVISDNKLAPALNASSYQTSDKDLGRCLIEIAKSKLETGCDTDWRKLHPLYIQPPAVSVKKS